MATRGAAATASVLVLILAAAAPAGAQALVPGGLTELAAVKLGPTLVKNGGFETVSESLPAGWSGGGGWAVDQIVRRSGNFSYSLAGSSGGGEGRARQTVQLTKGVYKLSGWIKTESAGSGRVRLTLDFRSHGINEWYPTADVSGTTDWTYRETIIIVPQDRTASVDLDGFFATPDIKAWFDDVKLEEQVPPSIDAFMLYPNYRGMLFDDQPPTLRFDVTVTPPGDDLARHDVKVSLAAEGGTVIASRTYPAEKHLAAELDGSGMQSGTPYRVTLSLIDTASETVVDSSPAFRVSKVPASARQSMNVAFDAKNRVLVRGVPRFVLGVYDAGLDYGTTDAFWEETLWSPTGERRMDGLNINFYLNYWYGEATPESMKSLMANLQKRGVMYLQTGNCFGKSPAGDNFLINSSDAYVRDIGGHAGSAGYYVADECNVELSPGVFEHSRRLRDLDPDSITFAALFGTPDIHLWRDAADIIASDPYPMFGPEPADGYNHRQVADWTAETREAVKDARPFMTVLQFFKFTSEGRWPTLDEMRGHAYMAIVEGARGLWWWSLGTNALTDVCAGWCEQKTTYMNNLKAVVNELAALEPVLLADDQPDALTGNSNPSATQTKVKIHDGKGYVFAYNGTNQTVSATFTWNTTPGTVTVNAEDRTIAASGNRFTDSFSPYQAHVYVIGQGGAGGTDGGGSNPDPAPAPDPDPSPTPGNPTVAFTNPQAGAALTGTVTVSLQGAGGSDNGYSYTVGVDGTTIYSGTNPSFSWNTTTVGDGARTLTATVKDSAGTTGSATLAVKVANGSGGGVTPPPSGPITVSFPSLTEGQTVSGGSVQVTIRASGTSGSQNRFWISVDDTQHDHWIVSGSEIKWWWTLTGLSSGEHTLSVKVQDATGQTGINSLTIRRP